ncbi:MAG: Gfo/Idh/MocA family oxidoreductase [Lentisphaeria bacterium]|nr:Gfo/Idh/MocA family oxidoreductase [Lentisphaeria bacterium]
MDKIRTAIIGCGGMGGVHAQRMGAMEEVEFVALCDLTEEIAGAFRERLFGDDGKDLPVYAGTKAMYAGTPDLDAVIIATPHTIHFEQGMEALDAGCHVFMEKPMVTSAEHAYKLAAKVEESGKIMTIGYNTSCSPQFDYLREKIRSNAFGKLELVSGYLCQDWMNFTEGKWRRDPAQSGGGQAYDSGAHLLNSMIWSVESRPAEVFAFLDSHGTRVDINSVISIRFENGVLGSICIGGNCSRSVGYMTFIFEKGRVDLDGWNSSWMDVFAEGETVEPEFGKMDQTPDRNFVDAVLGRCAPKTSPVNGIHHTELMDAIYESARTGQPARPKSQA